MSRTSLKKRLKANNRSDIRKEVINWFLNEMPGTGTEASTSSYEYVVDSFGYFEIFLKRPAILNKGFDFTINVRSIDSSVPFSFPRQGKKKPIQIPSHNHIVAILESVKKNNKTLYENKIMPIIDKIYNCDAITFVGKTITTFSLAHLNSYKFPIEIVLLCLKWLFIEQDVTYWNWSGREKLFNKLQTAELV